MKLSAFQKESPEHDAEGHRPCPTAVEEALCRTLTEMLSESLGKSGQLVISRLDVPVVCRPRTRLPGPPFPPAAFAAVRLGLLPVMPLRALFLSAAASLPGGGDTSRRPDPLMVCFALVADDFAGRLAGAIGAGSAFPPAAEPRDLPAIRARLIDGSRQAQQHVNDAADCMRDTLKEYCGPAGVIILTSSGGERLGHRLRADNTPEQAQLQEVVRRIVAPAARRIAEIAANNAAPTQDGALLDGVHPRVRAVLERAWSDGKPAGARLCMASLDGVPVELFLTARRDALLIDARRAHEEFILQTRTQGYCYFPPCQVVARYTLAAGAPQKWSIALPLIRQPAGGITWSHPFCSMSECPAVTRLDDARDEAMFEISEEARRLALPVLPRAAEAVEGTVCLAEEAAAIAQENAKLQGEQPDLLSITRAVWTIARYGLTRAHQLGPWTGRGPYEHPFTPCKVVSPSAIRGKLAERTFRYDATTAM